jgi:uncharacterized protein YjbI with pentapeptide repeats
MSLQKISQEELLAILEKHKNLVTGGAGKEKRANFTDVDLEGLNLEKCYLKLAIFKNSCFKNANLTEANLSSTELQNVDFSDACLKKAQFLDANLNEISFKNAKLQNTVFRGIIIKKVDFEGADLRDADFENATLIECSFKSVDLGGANFEDAKLGGANLNESNLEGANFKSANLSYAKIKNANLKDADLEDATGLGSAQLGGTKFTGAKLPNDFREFAFLDVIAEISKNARKVFFVMLLACVYSLLTIATTTDAQLLVNSASSPLPIIRTQIPIAWFYLAAPIILMFNYFYFHLYLQRLWEGLSSLPARFTDGKRADELAYPWILNSLVRRYFMLLKKDRPIIAVLEEYITIFVGWWVVPVTLFALWLRYLPRHYLTGTILQITLLVISIGLAIWFLGLTRKTLEGNPPKPIKWRKILDNKRKFLKNTTFVITTALLLSIAWYGLFTISKHGMNVGSKDLGVFKLIAFTGYRPYAELTEEELSIKPPNWTGKEEQIELVKGAKLRGANLQNAEAIKSFLLKADLRLANLQEANLYRANLQEADLRGANLQEADLRVANLQEANLLGANLQKAELWEANLQEADLSRAELRGAKNLTIDKLSKVKTLYQAILDPELEKQLKEKHPHLFEKPKEK